jgi:hypothetical protein
MDVQGHAERRVGVADSRRDRVAQAAQIGRLWHGPGGTLTVAACATGGRMVVAEEHHSEDRLGSAVIAALMTICRSRPRETLPPAWSVSSSSASGSSALTRAAGQGLR